ncbi:MAG TPA: cation transporter [Bacteroidales bacterium]|nr:cation transporter [Bacteroidales bacterium]
MKTLKFKTNINCGGCIAKVTPSLNQVKGIKKWEVDIANPQKVLTVETEEQINEADVIKTLKEVGYNAEVI